MRISNKVKTESTSTKNGIYRNYIKRAMDFIVSLKTIILLSPLLLFIALLVRIKMGSPVLFKQKRPGLNEEIFSMYKFRSMTDKRDDNGELLPDSLRLTKLGKFLRKTSIDELPELFNILRGEMSFVGPRPLSVNYLPYYSEKEKIRHNVRPGLTGLAQINGRNKLSWEQRFALDGKYVKEISFKNDLKIIFKTFYVVFKKDEIVTRGTGMVGDFHKERMGKMKRVVRSERNRK